MKQIPELRDVASDQQNNGLGLTGGYRPRYGRPSRHHAAERGRHALRCLRPAPGLHHLHSGEPVSRDSRNRPAMAAERRQRCSDLRIQIGSASQNLASTVALAGTNTALTGAASQPQAPLGAFTTRQTVPMPISINHQGQFPVVTLSFNLAPGASLGRPSSTSATPPRKSACPAASRLHSRARRPLSRIAQERADSDPRRHRHRLHRARRAVRKLHSPHHDSLDAAFGGRGRHPRPDYFPARIWMSSRSSASSC